MTALKSSFKKQEELEVQSEENESLPASNEEDSSSNADPGSGGEASDNVNTGWANSVAKVLRSTKPKNKKSIVLSRAKKLTNKKVTTEEKKPYDFQIENEINEEKPDIKNVIVSKDFKKNIALSLRVPPSIMDRDREKALKKVATKGVVQLFNAVRSQQKDIIKQLEAAGPLDHKKDAVLNNINKRKFLDVLMGGDRAKSTIIDNPLKKEKLKKDTNNEDNSSDNDDSEKEVDSKKQWSVLRDDFMTGKKIQHWDKDESETENDNVSSENESDMEE